MFISSMFEQVFTFAWFVLLMPFWAGWSMIITGDVVQASLGTMFIIVIYSGVITGVYGAGRALVERWG